MTTSLPLLCLSAALPLAFLIPEPAQGQSRTSPHFHAEAVAGAMATAGQYPALGEAFRSVRLYRLDAAAIYGHALRSGETLSLMISAGNGQEWNMDLVRRDVRSSSYRLRVSTPQGISDHPPGPSYTWRGTVNGSPESRAALSIRPGGISGLVIIAGLPYYIEPVQQFDPSAPADLYVMYTADDLSPASAVRCGYTVMQELLPERLPAHGVGPDAAPACQLAEVALAAERRLTTQLGSVAAVEAKLTDLMNGVITLYEVSTIEISYTINEIYISGVANEITPESELDITKNLSNFRDWGEAGGFSSVYDLATFWTTTNHNNYDGYAWLGVVCGTWRYNMLRYTQYGDAVNRNLQAHEMGHNWNASHVTQNNNNIMAPTVYASNTQWSAQSQNSIATHKGSRTCLAASCSLAPVAGFTASISACDGVVQFTDNSTNGPTSWQWEFGDGSTSSQQNPVHTYAASGTYTVKLTAVNGAGSDTELKTGFVTITLPAPPTTTDGANCNPGVVTMTAAGSGGTLEWYNAASGGSLVNTGTTYSPSLTVSTPFYVQEVTPGPPYSAGPADNTFGTYQYYASATARGLRFDALSGFTLGSVKVFAGSAGNRLIEILDGGGNVVYSQSHNIPTGESRVTLNVALAQGNNYLIRASRSTSNIEMARNDGNTSYPYTVPGVLSIRESSFTNDPLRYYYFFYDWDISGPGCISSRTEVWGYIGCTGLEEVHGVSLHVYPNPLSGPATVSWSGPAASAGWTIRMYDLGGRLAAEMTDLDGSSIRLEYGLLSAGMYVLELTDEEGSKARTKLVVR